MLICCFPSVPERVACSEGAERLTHHRVITASLHASKIGYRYPLVSLIYPLRSGKFSDALHISSQFQTQERMRRYSQHSETGTAMSAYAALLEDDTQPREDLRSGWEGEEGEPFENY